MNGFSDEGLDESNFGGPAPGDGALNAVKAFDAFPKTKPSYIQRTRSGGVWTVVLALAALLLTSSELRRWWVGETTHSFSVEEGVGHDLQINLDVVVKMRCEDLHVNVQDASGDRILAGQALAKDPTWWRQWDRAELAQRRRQRALEMERERAASGGGGGGGGGSREYREEDVHDYLGAARSKKKFPKTPSPPRGVVLDSCRIFGSIHGNKVQGDFHITARGHGYAEFGQHLDHKTFNFSHTINELSFGPFYPSLVNPLDETFATTDANFEKFQYYLSVVPTVYTTDAKALHKIGGKQRESPSSGEDGLRQHPYRYSRNTVFTNQYAVTEQNRVLPESMRNVPGIFVKFDIEPIMLTIAEEWTSVSALFIRIVNVVSGVLVAGGWIYQFSEFTKEFRRGGRRVSSLGMLNGGMDEKRGL